PPGPPRTSPCLTPGKTIFWPPSLRTTPLQRSDSPSWIFPPASFKPPNSAVLAPKKPFAKNCNSSIPARLCFRVLSNFLKPQKLLFSTAPAVSKAASETGPSNPTTPRTSSAHNLVFPSSPASASASLRQPSPQQEPLFTISAKMLQKLLTSPRSKLSRISIVCATTNSTTRSSSILSPSAILNLSPQSSPRNRAKTPPPFSLRSMSPSPEWAR